MEYLVRNTFAALVLIALVGGAFWLASNHNSREWFSSPGQRAGASQTPGPSQQAAASIVGKWRADENPGNITEFTPDGWMLEVTSQGPGSGRYRYRLLGGGRLETETDELPEARKIATWQYSINGNKLTTTLEGGRSVTRTWTRMN